jgi:hypothetical protein
MEMRQVITAPEGREKVAQGKRSAALGVMRQGTRALKGRQRPEIEKAMPKKLTIKLEKEKLRPRERAPILPTKKFEDKRRKSGRQAKHKKDLRRSVDQ